MWGGWNGGVVPENVSVSSGTLKLEGHGNLYTGDVQGCNKNLPGGIRTGRPSPPVTTMLPGAMRSWRRWRRCLARAPRSGHLSTRNTTRIPRSTRSTPTRPAKLAIVNHEVDIELPRQTPISTHTHLPCCAIQYLRNGKPQQVSLSDASRGGRRWTVAYLPLRLAYRRCERAGSRGFLCGRAGAVYQLTSIFPPCQPSVAGYLVPGVQGQRQGTALAIPAGPEPLILIPPCLKLTLSGSPLLRGGRHGGKRNVSQGRLGRRFPSPRY